VEQLFLVAIIVAFSILEAVARRQKRRRQGGAGTGLPPVPEEWGEKPESRREPPPLSPHRSYDQDPSFDDAVEEDVGRRVEPGMPPAAGSPVERAPATPSSEDLIPVDIWEEIAALARGERPGVTPPPPAPSREPAVPASSPSRVESVPREIRVPTPEPDRPGTHPVHLTHPQLGKPVSERLTAPARRRTGARPGKDVRAVRRLLAGGGTSLRQAVILHEILGPPASQREDFGDPSA
jgi:hypothetical protein